MKIAALAATGPDHMQAQAAGEEAEAGEVLANLVLLLVPCLRSLLLVHSLVHSLVLVQIRMSRSLLGSLLGSLTRGKAGTFEGC